jgi:nucleoid-associated protein YgaU
MGNRYDNKTLFQNQSERYESIFEERGVKYVRQYGTSEMLVPTISQRVSFSTLTHIWKVGDKFYKLAIQYYSDPQYWWVIALYNQTPTEADLRTGDPLTIPLPLEKVLRTIRS